MKIRANNLVTVLEAETPEERTALKKLYAKLVAAGSRTVAYSCGAFDCAGKRIPNGELFSW